MHCLEIPLGTAKGSILRGKVETKEVEAVAQLWLDEWTINHLFSFLGKKKPKGIKATFAPTVVYITVTLI